MGNEPKFWDSVREKSLVLDTAWQLTAQATPAGTHPSQAGLWDEGHIKVETWSLTVLFGEDMDFDAYGGKAF